MNAEQLQWFKSLKPGDKVAYGSGYGLISWSLARVTEVTKSGRVRVGFANDPNYAHYFAEFNSDGSERGRRSGGPRSLISPLTPEITDELFRAKAIAKLCSVSWRQLKSDQLKRILDIVKESQP